MSFGTYINNPSFVHKLNPSLKFLICVFFIILVFMPLGFFGQMILLVSAFILWISAKLPMKMMWNIIKSVLAMFAILLFINWMAYKAPGFSLAVDTQCVPFFWGGTKDSFWENLIKGPGSIWPDESGKHYAIWGHIWGGEIDPITYSEINEHPNGWKYVIEKITIDGKVINRYLYYTNAWYSLSTNVLAFAGYVSIKIFLMITIITLLVSTTSSIQLTFAIEDILSPLKIIKIPVNEWAMTISIAIRFVPSLLDESQKILRAQASRGVDFSNGNYKDKMKSLVSLVVPMFSVAFCKADDLANAMEARSYNPRYARSRYRSFSIDVFDWIIYIVASFILGIFIAITALKGLFAPFADIEAILIYG